MAIRRSALALAVVAVCAPGCTKELEERQTKLETRIDELEKRVTKLTEDSVVQNGQLMRRLEDLDRRLETLGEKLSRSAAPPPRLPRRPTRPRPDPTATYSVPIEDSPFVGPRDARVTIVKAFEFACPFCERVRVTLDQIRRDYGRDVRIVYKNFIVHPQSATAAALAGCAAARQGKFEKMAKLIWEKGFKNGRKLSEDHMKKLAKSAGLKMKRYKADIKSPCPDIVRRDQALLRRVGVTGTPAFFINGRFLSGARPYSQFQQIIDEELAKAKSSGIAAKDYYDHLVNTGLRELAAMPAEANDPR